MSAVELFIALDTERPKRRGCVRVIENARALVVGERTFTEHTVVRHRRARVRGLRCPRHFTPTRRPDPPSAGQTGGGCHGYIGDLGNISITVELGNVLVRSTSPLQAFARHELRLVLVGEGITRSDPGPRPRTPSPGPEDDPPQTLTPELEQDSLHLASRPYLLTGVLLRATELHRIPMVSLRAALVTTSSRHFYASTPLGSLPVAFARNRLALVYPTFQLYVSHEYPNFAATEPNPLAVLFSRTARECEPFLLSQLAFLPHKSSRFGPTLRDHFVLADPLS
ncbi:hypothetical protein BJY52DRAFT_1194787 [Lactarius psammicola]|nr:hypothetical protein BJY52DRAFT_1194787 [Lactarius psammicola]